MALRINDPSVGSALTELFGLQGRVQPELEEFIIPTVQVADLSKRSVPPPARRCAARFTVLATAAEFATWRFETPPSVVAVIRRIWMQPQADTHLQAFFGSSITPPAHTLLAGRYTDGRIRASPLGAVGAARIAFWTQVGTLGGLVNWQTAAPANDLGYTTHDLQWVVGAWPKQTEDFIEFQMAASNSFVRISMEWDEFFLS